MGEPVTTFDLTGSLWPLLFCFAFYLLMGIPIALALAWSGIMRRRLWLRAREKGYDDRRVLRAAAWLGLKGDFKNITASARFRAQQKFVGLRDLLLAVVMFVTCSGVFFWLPISEPVRMNIASSELVLDYRWPRGDRHIAVTDIRGIEWFTRHPKRLRSPTVRELRIRLRNGEQLTIQPPEPSGNYDTLRDAGRATAAAAGVSMQETVIDER